MEILYLAPHFITKKLINIYICARIFSNIRIINWQHIHLTVTHSHKWLQQQQQIEVEQTFLVDS